MKKYLYGALALPLLFACSADDLIEKEVVSNDQFAGIEKVDATFTMDEGVNTRMDGGSWKTEEGDLWGFAWLGDGTVIDATSSSNSAYAAGALQNHNLIQTNEIFTPQTSIYVGKYFIYRPYDKETVGPKPINFTLAEQPLAEGYESAKQPWKDLAKTAINIGDKWTEVSTTGWTDDDGNKWDEAGIQKHYKIYAAFFSNQTGLDLTYEKNDEAFDGHSIAGATDIAYTYPEGSTIGAADIYSVAVTLDGADNAFTYAPTSEPRSDARATEHSGTFWADKSDLATSGYTGFNFTQAAITLNAPDENGISTEGETTGWFWFNSLPVEDGAGDETTNVTAVLETSYGAVTVASTVDDCAYVFDKYDGTGSSEWIKLTDNDDNTVSPKTWDIGGTHNTFINQYGNHKGKYALTVDFSQGVMNGMHIKNDRHLQKALKYYIASGKTESPVVLNLDEDANGEFKISKISIALLQTINAGGTSVLVEACGTHGAPKIIVTQDDQAGLGLADKKEVPALNNVFYASTDVYLSSECEWTWGNATALPIDANVKSLRNEGKLTVNATNVQLSLPGVMIYNESGATMDITQVTTVKNTLHNYGKINVGSESNTSAELRAYNARIYNNATSLTAHGEIDNYGVIGSTSGTSGAVHNYGLITMKNNDAMTLLKSNETGTDPFGNVFNKTSNKMGTVVLPENNPTAIVSVSNAAENGFIKYNWTGATYATPAGNVKYNTIVVSADITFTADEEEIQYIEFDGVRTQVVNPVGNLTNLKGIIVNKGKSIIIEKGNTLKATVGAYLGTGATIYKGGTFTYPSGGTTNYFGTWSTDQVVVYGD